MRQYTHDLNKIQKKFAVETNELKSKSKPRPAYDCQRKRILALQAEIDEKAKLISLLSTYLIEAEINVPVEVWDEIDKHGE
jgi:hypothetical protein